MLFNLNIKQNLALWNFAVVAIGLNLASQWLFFQIYSGFCIFILA